MTRWDGIAGIGVLALGLLGFGGVLGFEFVSWDDPSYVTENGKVLRGLTWDNGVWAFTTLFFANWHPLTWLSHMAVVEVAGTDPAAHHAVNLFLHLANALLCYAFFAGATGDRLRAFLVAALFVVHPLHAETVAWVSDRKMLLAVMFMGLTLITYRHYVKRPAAGRYGLVLLCAAMAMLSKPTAVVLAGLLFLADYWPLKAGQHSRMVVLPARTLILEKMPVLMMGGVLGGITLLAQQWGGAVVSTLDLPAAVRVSNAVLSWGRYVFGIFWPGERQFFYALPDPWPWGMAMLSAAVLVGSAVLAWRLRHQRPALLFGWFWFLLLVLPTLGLIKVGSQAMADRYVYFASVGVFVAVVWSIPVPKAGWGRAATLAGMLFAAAGLIVQANRTVIAWRDSETLYRATLAVDGENAVAHGLLAEVLADRGDLELAAGHARRALARPLGGNLGMLAETVLGRAALAQGDADLAREHFLRARGINPDFHQPAYWLAEAELARGDRAAAQAWLMQALRARPVYPEAFEALARVAWLAGDPATAQRHWHTALAADRRSVAACVGLAVLHAQAGDAAGWTHWMQEARRLDPRRTDEADAALRRAWANRDGISR